MVSIKRLGWGALTLAILLVPSVHASPPVTKPATITPVSIQQLESELAGKPEDRATRNALAVALYKDGQFNRAADVYAPLYNARPTELRVVEKYAMLMVAAGESKEDVESIYGRLLDWGPMSSRAEAWASVAKVYTSESNWDSAENAFRKVLTADEKNVTVLKHLGDYRFSQGQFGDAARIYLQLPPLTNNDPVVQRRLIESYLMDRHSDSAAPLIQALLAKDPKDVVTLTLQGYAFLQDNKAEDAVLSFSNALQADPHASRARNYRARAYAILRQFDKAIADARTIVEQDPSSFDARLNLASFLGQNNQLADAEKLFQELIATNPESTLDGKYVRFEYDKFLVAHGSPAKYNAAAPFFVTFSPRPPPALDEAP